MRPQTSLPNTSRRMNTTTLFYGAACLNRSIQISDYNARSLLTIYKSAICNCGTSVSDALQATRQHTTHIHNVIAHSRYVHTLSELAGSGFLQIGKLARSLTVTIHQSAHCVGQT